MKSLIFSLFIVITIAFSFSACKKKGCTDPIAENFDLDAAEDDGSCAYIDGCTDASAANYNPNATRDDGSCIFTGQVVFWQDGSPSYGYTYVTIESTTETIKGDYPSYSPDCNAYDCAVFALTPDYYYYYAQEASGPGYWQGFVTVTANYCTQILLD